MSRRLVAAALRSRLARHVLTGAGIALAGLLVLVLLAAHRSLEVCVRAYLDRGGADLWIAPHGTDNLIRSSGFLPPDTLRAARAVPGVAAADPVVRMFVTATRGGRRLTLLAIGYRAPWGPGGPPEVERGRAPAAPLEVALDRGAAFRLGATVGRSIRINGHRVVVSGITRDTNLLATQFVFGDVRAASRAGNLPDLASLVAVRVARGQPVPAVAERLRTRLPGTDVLTRREFVRTNLREVTAGIRPLLALIAALGSAVAAVLVGLLVQAVAAERRPDIAVLFALGAPASLVALGLLRQALGLALAGAAAAAALAGAGFFLLDRLLPTVSLSFSGPDALLVSGLFALAATLAASVPVLRLRRIDPVEAFRP